MYLEVITPEKKIFEGEVTIATFPGSHGSFQVMNNHAPMVTTLTKGNLSYKTKEGVLEEHEIDGGVVEVLRNQVIVLAETVMEES